jgi:hypothetical protein
VLYKTDVLNFEEKEKNVVKIIAEKTAFYWTALGIDLLCKARIVVK